MKKEIYLSELQTVADSITSKYLREFEKSVLEPDEFINSIADNFKKELADKGAEVFHKSIMNGIDDKTGLIIGVQNINFESVINLRKKIGA